MTEYVEGGLNVLSLTRAAVVSPYDALVVVKNATTPVTAEAQLAYVAQFVAAGQQLPNVVTVQSVGDGVTDDSASWQLAIDTVWLAGGGIVWVPPAPKGYNIHNVFVRNGVSLVSAGTFNYLGLNVTLAEWVSKGGAWIVLNSTTQSHIVVGSHGASVKGFAFIGDQPVPSGAPYTPNHWAWAIECTGTMFTLDNIFLVGVGDGINVNYQSASGGGTYCRIDNIYGAGFFTTIKLTNVNDVVKAQNWQLRPLWYMTHDEVVKAYENTAIGVDFYYCDNLQLSDFQSYQLAISMRFTNGTVPPNTHSAYNVQFRAIQSFAKQHMVITGNATVTGSIHDFLTQTDVTQSTTALAIDLRSNNVDLEIVDLKCNGAGGQFMEVGAGTGGKVKITGLKVLNWSTNAPGQPLIVSNAGAKVFIGGPRDIHRTGGAGQIYTGAGEFFTGIQEWTVYGTFGEITQNGTSSFIDVSLDNNMLPEQLFAKQMRIRGNINITTPVAGVGQVRMQSRTSIITPQFSSAGAGNAPFDSNWIDLDDGGPPVGRVGLYFPTGGVWKNGNLSVMFR